MEKKEEQQLFTIDVISRCVSSFGDLIFYPVMLAIAASMPHPAQAMLLVSLSESIPIFLAVFIGVFADRLPNALKSMHIFNVLRFMLYMGVGLLFFQSISLAFYVTIIINFISDCIGKTYNPLANALFVTYADEKKMVEKQGVLSSVQGVVQIIAPLLGTVLLATLSYGVIGIINACTFLVTSLILLAASKQFKKYNTIVMEQRQEHKDTLNVWGQIKKSFQFIFKNNALTQIVLCCLVVNMFTIPLVRIILPMFLLDNVIATTANLATKLVFMNTAFAAGNILGSLGSRFLKKYPMFRIFSIAMMLIAILTSSLAFVQYAYLLNIGFFFIGIVSGVINTLFMGYIMQIVTQDIMGGVTNAITLISAGGGIVGDLSATSLLAFLTSSTLIKGIGLIVFLFGVGFCALTWKRRELVVA